MAQMSVEQVVEAGQAEVLVSGPDEALRRLAGELPGGVRVVDADTLLGRGRESAPDLPGEHVLWLGWPGQEVAGLDGAAERLWVFVDHADLASLQARRGPEIMEQIAAATRVRGVITPDAAGLEYLSRRAPRQAAGIYGLDAGASVADALAQVRSVRCGEGSPAVLLHRPHRSRTRGGGPPAGPVLHELCETAEQLHGSAADAVHLLGAPDAQRENGRIRPRNAAWHLAAAAQALGDAVLITDDVAVGAVLAGYKSLDASVWVLLDGPTVSHCTDPGSAQHAEVVQALLAVIGKGGRILVGDAGLREALRGVGELGGRVLLAGEDGALDLGRIRELVGAPGRAWSVPQRTTVLLAGHDFKFAGELVQILEQVRGVELLFDRWARQDQQSVDSSDRLLRQADVVLCEFASHNAVWYSWHKLPGQRLVVHFHGYELFQDWIPDINVANVDLFVFVSEFYRDKVVRDLGWPRERTTVVPNMIDVDDLDRPQAAGARFHLGIVGIVPVLKRPDRALDLLERLLEEDDRYVLHVRGRDPWDYQWMWRDPVVRDAYESFYERLAASPRLLNHVAFDAFGPDMGRWFQRVGWTLSPSFRETFHLAPVEGMAGGAVPVVWEREGAREIFDGRWVHPTTEEAARFILAANASAEAYDVESARAREHVRRYSLPEVAPAWWDVMFGAPGHEVELDPGFLRQDLEERYAERPTPAALDRLLLLVLKRDRDLEAARSLLAGRPVRTLELSQETRELLERTLADEAFAQATSRRPPRCEGAVYQVRHGGLLVVDLDRDGDGAPDGTSVLVGAPGDPVPACRLPGGTQPAHAVQIVADAIVRRARLERPEVLVTVPAWECAWPTVVAARRLGVPAVLAGELPPEGHGPDAGEFDAVAGSVQDVTAGTVGAAVARHRGLAARHAAPALEEITVGIIADEFTRRTVSGRCRTVVIHREDAYVQVASEPLDVLFVESAWTGPDNEWFHGIAYYENDHEDIRRVVKVARARGIPVVFWNKEDPVHFRSFAPTAALCDAVFTTDADRIPDYLLQGGAEDAGRPRTAASLPFYAEPRLHNPLPGAWAPRRTVSYAGTYYGQRYAERSAELDRILHRAARHGLTIYDRQLNHPGSPYRFPEEYGPFIEGGLSYDDVLEAYKAHPVHINVNSVDDSPTMFSRRVVEIAASGSVVVSGRGRGLNEMLPDVPATEDVEVLDRIMGACLTDRRVWAEEAWTQLRAVRRAHLADQALTIMFRSAGLPVRLSAQTAWTAEVAAVDDDLVDSLLEQTLRPAAVRAAGPVDPAAATRLESAGITVGAPAGEHWTIDWRAGLPPTWAEDLLYAGHFCPADVTTVGARRHGGEPGLLSWDAVPDGPVFRRPGAPEGRRLVWLLPGEPHLPAHEDGAR